MFHKPFNLTTIKIPYYAKVNGGAVVGGSHKRLPLIPACVLPCRVQMFLVPVWM